jgi:hypothetical protein
MKAGLLLSLLLFTSCVTLSSNMTKRQRGYLECAQLLLDSGIKQELIIVVCDKAVEK